MSERKLFGGRADRYRSATEPSFSIYGMLASWDDKHKFAGNTVEDIADFPN